MLYTGYANVSVIKEDTPMKKLKRIAALTLAAACAATVCAGAAFTDQSDIKVDSKVIDTLVEKNVIFCFFKKHGHHLTSFFNRVVL